MLLFGISHLNLLWADIYLWGVVKPDAISIISGVITISLIGFLLGVVRIKTDSLYPAILAHSIGNFFMILIPTLIFYG